MNKAKLNYVEISFGVKTSNIHKVTKVEEISSQMQVIFLAWYHRL